MSDGGGRADERSRSARLPDVQSASVVRFTVALYWGAVSILLVLLVLRIVHCLSSLYPLDDAYMFVRYADHLIHNGSMSWNVPGKPTYGLTAPAYLALLVPLRLLASDSPGAAILTSSILSGVVFLTLLYVLLLRYAGASGSSRPIVTLFVLGSLTLGSYPLGFHFTSGMDTMFALAVLTAFILAHKHNEDRPSPTLTGLLGLASGLIFFARPDLMIYAAGVSGVGFLIAPDTVTRRRFAAILGIGAILLVVELLCCRAYFGLPLPLPFYAKGLHSYTGHILSVYRRTAFDEFAAFLRRYWPLLLVVLFSLPYLLWRHGSRVFTPVELGLAFSTVVFVGYYLFFVLQIMPHESRFYYPVLPALLFLSARSIVLLVEGDGVPAPFLRRLRTSFDRYAHRRPRMAVGIAIFALSTLTCIAGYRARHVVLSIRALTAQRLFDVRVAYQAIGLEYWYRLDEISRLPDDLVIGTTEVGMPSAFNPGKTIIDLAGLNDTEVARHGFRMDGVLARNHPDVIYMPHPHYTDLNRELLDDPEFDKEYELFTSEQVGCLMGVALRRDGKYFLALHAIALKGHPRGDGKAPS